MEYYYDREIFKNFKKLEDLKKAVEIHAQPLGFEISKVLLKTIGHFWTRRDTLGFVFTDFEFQTGKSLGLAYKRLIGKGEKDLFRNIKDKFVFLVMTKTSDKNFRIVKVGNKQGIVVNVDYFKEFLNVMRDSKNTVKLFLYSFESKQQEELVRRWLRNYGTFEEIQKETTIIDIDAIIEVVKKYKIEKAADLDRLITIARASGERIKSDYEFFEKRVNEFKSKIQGNVDEYQLRDFMFQNIWLLDFQYTSYSKKKEEGVSIGEIDISLLKDELGLNRAVVVELKKASKQIVTEKYRGEEKPAILAEVGKAISQTIHYIEQKKGPYKVLRGIVIIGRKTGKKEEFLGTLNQYLHGIEVLTYDDICERAEKVIEIFKPKPPNPSTDIVPVPPAP